MSKCNKCNGTLFVCENHPDQEAHKCKHCGGAGMPCECTEPVSGWISVEDRLPSQDINVLVYDQVSNQLGIASLSIEMGNSEHGDNKLYVVWEDIQFHDRDEPTHWMPLPNPPKEN